MTASKLDGSLPARRRSNSAFSFGSALARRPSQSVRGLAPALPAVRQASRMSAGISKGGESQLKNLRAPAISSAPSGEPYALLVPALVGAPKPIVVLQAIIVGLSEWRAASMA